MMRALRWAFVPFLAPLGYIVAVLTASVLTQVLQRLCPANMVVSGMCTASWYSDAEIAAFAFATGVGAMLWVLLPTLAAPGHRRHVAWIAYVLGAIYATWFISQVGAGFAIPFGSALATGAISAMLISSRYSPNREVEKS
jgi:hypothetical protein